MEGCGFKNPFTPLHLNHFEKHYTLHRYFALPPLDYLVGKKLKSMLSTYGMFGEVIFILFQMGCKQNIRCNLFKYIYNL